MNLRELTEIERKTYEFIKEAGEIQPKNMPDSRMVGAIASLKNKGLVEIIKKYTSIFRRKKKKFVKAIRYPLHVGEGGVTLEDCSSSGAEAWKETVRTLTLSKLDVFVDFFAVFVPLLDYFV